MLETRDLRGWVGRKTPSVSLFEQSGGVELGANYPTGGGSECEHASSEPLRLAIGAREGRRVCRQKKHPSVSHFKRGRGGLGGCVDRRNTPSISRFERGRGGVDWSGCVERVPLRLAFQARERTKGADAPTQSVLL